MDFFFYPRSVAIFGSFKEGAIAYEILRNIVDGGFEGRIIPVNPKGGTVQVSGKPLKSGQSLRSRLILP